MPSMTKSKLRTGYAGITALASLGITIAAAMGADTKAAGETFMQTAEKWGLWAAISIALVAFSIYAMYRMGVYITTNLESNNIATVTALNRIANTFDNMGDAFRDFTRNRPCLRDSDADRFIGDEELTPSKEQETISRRQRRKADRET